MGQVRQVAWRAASKARPGLRGQHPQKVWVLVKHEHRHQGRCHHQAVPEFVPQGGHAALTWGWLRSIGFSLTCQLNKAATTPKAMEMYHTTS
jgi:hypothetical protein